MFFLKGSNSKPLPPINFAACWNCAESPREFIDLDQEIYAPQFLIPPIMLHEFDQGYHLVLDFFRNDWMIRVDDERIIPVPTVLDEATPGETPFLNNILYYSENYRPFEIFEDEYDSDE
jgi:hypothetical protein